MQDMQIEDVNSAIGARVAELRRGRYSQAELAEQLSERLGKPIDPTTITRLEGGKRPIAATELVALSEIFGTSPAELLPEWRPVENSARYWEQRANLEYAEFQAIEAKYEEAKTQANLSAQTAEGLKLLAEYKKVRRWCTAYAEALRDVWSGFSIGNREGRPNTFVEILEDIGVTPEQISEIRSDPEFAISDDYRLIDGVIRVLSSRETGDK